MAPAPTLGSRPAAILAALLLFALAFPVAGAAGGASPPAKAPSQVYLVQGVPGGPADVSIDGETVTSGLEPTAVFGPVDVPLGRHMVAFEGDGWTVEAPINIGNRSEDVVVHLPADSAADPIVTVFANNVQAVREGHGRVTVAHTAVVPPADIRAGGEVLFANVANGEFVTAEVPADTYEVDVVPTGGDDPLLGPLDLEVTAAALTRVFAIGQPENGSMTAVVQVIPLGERSAQSPSSVGAGEAGLVAPGDERGSDVWLPPLLALVMGVLFLALHRRRHVRS
jgi:hypothetical protein